MAKTKGTILGFPKQVLSYDGDGVDTVIQSTNAPVFQYFLMEELKTDITLTDPTVIGSELINVSAGHGFTAVSGEVIELLENGVLTQLRVVAIPGTNQIRVRSPMTKVFTPAASVIRGNINLNVDASGGAKSFFFKTKSIIRPVDIHTIKINMQHSSAGDDSLFGGISAIPQTSAIYAEKNTDMLQSLGSMVCNQCFKDLGMTAVYTDKAGGGKHATELTLDVKDVFDQEFRLGENVTDYIRFVTRSNLAGLVRMVVSLLGSYTKGEELV